MQQAVASNDAAGPRGLAAVFGPTVNAIFAPAQAFEALEARPLLALWILLWVIVVMSAVSLLNVDVQRQFMRVGFVESMAQGDQQMDAEQARRVLETMDRWAPAIGILQNLVLVLLVLVITVMLWAGASMLGGSARFGNAFAVAAVASVIHPALAGMYMSLVWAMDPPQIRRMADIPSAVPTLGLDLLVGNEGMSMMARTFLMRIDLFNAWWVVLIVIGAGMLLRVKRNAAIALALTIWMITAGTGAVLSGLNG